MVELEEDDDQMARRWFLRCHASNVCLAKRREGIEIVDERNRPDGTVYFETGKVARIWSWDFSCESLASCFSQPQLGVLEFGLCIDGLKFRGKNRSSRRCKFQFFKALCAGCLDGCSSFAGTSIVHTWSAAASSICVFTFTWPRSIHCVFTCTRTGWFDSQVSSK